MPGALVKRLNQDLRTVIADDRTQEKILARGLEPADTTPAEFARHIRSEIERWQRVIAEAGIQKR